MLGRLLIFLGEGSAARLCQIHDTSRKTKSKTKQRKAGAGGVK